MSQMNMGPPRGEPGRPGQMTAVMRAMAQATGPKVLRIGLVTGGRIIEERIIKQRTSVTVGPSEKSMFVTQATSIPPQFKLFELIGNEYYLNFVEGMSGRVALQTGIADLTGLRGQARRVGNAYQVKLTDDARGKVVVGETTFLFQFVAPPPIQPRPQLPLSVKSGNKVDWNFTMITAMSLLSHVAVLLVLMPGGGWFCKDACRADENENRTARLQAAQAKLPDLPATAKPADTGDKGESKDEAKPDKPQPKPQQQAKGPPAQANPAQAEARVRALEASANKFLLDKLAALGGDDTGRVTGPAGTSANATTGRDLADAVGRSNGVGQQGAFAGSGGHTVGPGGRDIAAVGTGTGGGPTPTVTAEIKKDIKFSSNQTGVSASVPVQNAEATVRSLSGQASFCYKQGLLRNENQQGRVALTITVGPGGDVQGASASPSGVDAGVANCIAAAARRLHFGKDENRGQATISTAFNFVKQ